MKTRLMDAIAWSGRDVGLSLFVVFRAAQAVQIDTPRGADEPQSVRQYDLEDVDDRLPGRSCREYDLIYDEVPQDLQALIESWIAEALTAGADFAWFGFEGSFDFEHILTADVADQLYAVGAPGQTHVAIDDRYREGPNWSRRVASMREKLGLSGE